MIYRSQHFQTIHEEKQHLWPVQGNAAVKLRFWPLVIAQMRRGFDNII